MQFQILKLIIWPTLRAFPPRVLDFIPGKVNVITGGSRSGKSAIIPIIDYCLASSECQIPIDTIRDTSAWYGIVVMTEHEQLLIARKGPNGRVPADEFFLMRGAQVSVPLFIEEPNQKQENVKHLLNAISGVPYFKLSGAEDPRPYQDRLGFRDLMALVFQSQEVVANQNILFYKTHAHEHRERLKNWFPYILGAENIEVLEARQRLSVVQSKLGQLRREAERARRVSASWLANMSGHLQIAKSYGLLAEDFAPSPDPSEMLEVAKSILATPTARPQPTVNVVSQAIRDVAVLEAEDDKLSDEVSLLRRRLGDLDKLRSGLVGYGNTARRRADRLHISQWFRDIASTGHECPLCGSDDHDNAQKEIGKIAAAFEDIEVTASKTTEVPAAFAREESALRLQLDETLAKQKNLNRRLDSALEKNKAAKEQFDRKQSMHFFLGHLKASLETFESLTPEGSVGEQIAELEKDEQRLLGIVDPQGVARRLAVALTDISQRALVLLQSLDVEDKYKRLPPEFSVKDLNLRVLSNDGHWHFLSEVGSASNWVSFHIAFICALHEFFNSSGDSCVPSFAVFDQPSQVYFPRTSRSQTNSDVDKSQYADEDVLAVKGIFQTLANSVAKQQGKWQCIVLDHARNEIYGEIPLVQEIEVWRDGQKLIPREWYQ